MFTIHQRTRVTAVTFTAAAVVVVLFSLRFFPLAVAVLSVAYTSANSLMCVCRDCACVRACVCVCVLACVLPLLCDVVVVAVVVVAVVVADATSAVTVTIITVLAVTVTAYSNSYLFRVG